jgi:predicted phosphodiesterase
MSKVNIARDYREKYGWDMPTLKLARIIYNDNPLSFSSVDHARTSLRSIENKLGKKNNIITTKEMPTRPFNPYNLPESDEAIYQPYDLKAKRLLVLSDIHIPYHNIESLTCAFDFAKGEKPDAILLNGDTLDFFGLSRFSKDPKARSFAHELKTFKEFMDILKKTFNAKIYFKIGNHEERYFHFLWMKAHEIVGVEEFELENIIKSRAEGIEIIKDKRIIKAGDLNIIHGHEFGGSVFSPVNIARGLFLKGKVSAMQGHNHCSSEHSESNMNGELTTTWSVGCLCELHPAYLPINKWNHGFAIVDIDGQNFEVRNKRIHKGKIL